ncbi:hypothetical protein P7C70_g7851, partial [Phenoliferia sp. Uapishka_3]
MFGLFGLSGTSALTTNESPAQVGPLTEFEVEVSRAKEARHGDQPSTRSRQLYSPPSFTSFPSPDQLKARAYTYCRIAATLAAVDVRRVGGGVSVDEPRAAIPHRTRVNQIGGSSDAITGKRSSGDKKKDDAAVSPTSQPQKSTSSSSSSSANRHRSGSFSRNTSTRPGGRMLTTGPISPSSTTSSSADSQDLNNSIDALLDEDRPRIPSPPTRPHPLYIPHPNGSSSNAVAQLRFFYLVALLLFQTLSAYSLPSAALQNRTVATALPVVHYGLLLATGVILGCAQPKGKFGRGRSGWGRGDEGKRVRVLVGVLSTLAALTNIWQARWLEGKVWQAIEVFSIPLLILLPTLFSTPTIQNPTFIACTGSAFLVAFSLVGVPAAATGLFISLLKVGIEAMRLTFLKLGMAGERGGAFLLGSALVSSHDFLSHSSLSFHLPSRSSSLLQSPTTPHPHTNPTFQSSSSTYSPPTSQPSSSSSPSHPTPLL